MQDSKQADLLELAGHYSDFHKDVHGFRPSFSPECMNADWLNAQIKRLSDSLEQRKSTFEGREALREDGWIVEPETDPELIAKAKLSEIARINKYNEMVDRLYSPEMAKDRYKPLPA